MKDTTPGERLMAARAKRYRRGLREDCFGRPIWHWLVLGTIAMVLWTLVYVI